MENCTNDLYPVISKSVQLPISVRSIKSQLSITLKKSGFCNLFPRHLEDSPLIFQEQKDNLLDISGQTMVPIIDIDIIKFIVVLPVKCLNVQIK